MQDRSSSSVKVFYPKLDLGQVLDILRTHIPKLAKQLPLHRVSLFGSYARGEYTAASDIDLLVVYSGEKEDRAFEIVKKNLPLMRLEPHVYSRNEYDEVKGTLEKMVEGGVELFP